MSNATEVSLPTLITIDILYVYLIYALDLMAYHNTYILPESKLDYPNRKDPQPSKT